MAIVAVVVPALLLLLVVAMFPPRVTPRWFRRMTRPMRRRLRPRRYRTW